MSALTKAERILRAIEADIFAAVDCGELTPAQAARELAWAEADTYNEERGDRDDD